MFPHSKIFLLLLRSSLKELEKPQSLEQFLCNGRRKEPTQTKIVPVNMLYRSVVVKREISVKAKLSIYQLIYVPTLTCVHELQVD